MKNLYFIGSCLLTMLGICVIFTGLLLYGCELGNIITMTIGILIFKLSAKLLDRS